MISLDFSNLTKISPEHGLSKEELENSSLELGKYLQTLQTRGQGFYQVIDDENLVKKIQKFTKENKNKWQDIVILGIGGSALGTICLSQSLGHLFDSELKKRKAPKLHVLDNIDPILMKEILDVINLKKTLFIVVTKSGGTPETLAQYFYFRKILEKNKLKPVKHFVFITDPKVGLLRKVANEENIPTFEIPENVGGRFSVQTAVSLLPAALIGLNISKLLSGFQKMRDQFLSPNWSENLPFQLAEIQYLLGKKGKTINVLMPYAQKLIRLSDWYRQLLAESIGKEKNWQGQTVNVGLTPVSALGATDQHSQNQLYNEGPNDKLIIFVEVKKFGPEIKIPAPPTSQTIDYLKNVSFNKLINTEKKGTENALTQNNRPNLTIKMDTINEFTLGEILMMLEGATAFLGEFFSINAFDQPGVELSKQLTKEYLLTK